MRPSGQGRPSGQARTLWAKAPAAAPPGTGALALRVWGPGSRPLPLHLLPEVPDLCPPAGGGAGGGDSAEVLLAVRGCTPAMWQCSMGPPKAAGSVTGPLPHRAGLLRARRPLPTPGPAGPSVHPSRGPCPAAFTPRAPQPLGPGPALGSGRGGPVLGGSDRASCVSRSPRTPGLGV